MRANHGSVLSAAYLTSLTFEVVEIFPIPKLVGLGKRKLACINGRVLLFEAGVAH
jgi:hypothetical protein